MLWKNHSVNLKGKSHGISKENTARGMCNLMELLDKKSTYQVQMVKFKNAYLAGHFGFHQMTAQTVWKIWIKRKNMGTEERKALCHTDKAVLDGSRVLKVANNKSGFID